MNGRLRPVHTPFKQGAIMQGPPVTNRQFPAAPRGDELVAEIRSNVVFETMIGAVLTIAAAAGLAHLVIGIGWRLAGGLGLFSALLPALIAALSFSFVFFLAGFAFAVVIGIPMHRALEAAKIRRIAPYAGAALIVALAILALMGLAPSAAAPWNFLYLAPPLAAAFLFGVRMRAFWRAAMKADEATNAIVVRLH